MILSNKGYKQYEYNTEQLSIDPNKTNWNQIITELIKQEVGDDLSNCVLLTSPLGKNQKAEKEICSGMKWVAVVFKVCSGKFK